MIRILRWVAAIGLGVGISSLTIAFLIGGFDVRHFWDRANFNLQACGDGSAPANAAERHLAWSGGDRLELVVPATVRLRMGGSGDIVVRGAPDAISHIDVRGDRLVLGCRGQASSRDIEVTLPGNAFRRIDIFGWARLEMVDLNQPELALRLHGSGSIRARGTVDRLSLTVSGSGNGQLADLAIKELSLKISGSGDVEAAPRDAADVSISGSGTVRLLTRPARLKTHISGSGRVLQPSAEASEKR
jgi:hypothetical protein